jgi:NAD(P)H-hydrate epimerase
VKPILTPEQAAALDAACEARGIPTAALMERAGWHVARVAVDLLGGTYGRRIVVVAGKGNNGGDGLVAARYLDAWGARVCVHLLEDGLRDPAAENLARLGPETGVVVRSFGQGALERDLERSDLAVDAIFGTGFRGAAEGSAASAIALLAEAGVPVVAVDVPSGVSAATGAVDGLAVNAEATVTFGALKPGLVLAPGVTHAGTPVVVDIGFPPDLVVSDLALVEAGDVAAMLPVRAADAHKRSAGVVLVVGGSRDMTGAPALSALGAYRAGAGLVGIATVESRVAVQQGRVAEAVFLGLPETADGTMAAGAVDVLLEALPRYHAVAIGPGLSTRSETAEAIRRLVAEGPLPMVLDADGLNAFAGRAAELAVREAPTVLTPHAGELARLLGEDVADRIGSARKLAAATGAVVLAKGHPTVVAAPDGEARVNPTGGPSLATGGTGDVLTGVVAAMLARGADPFDAATAAAYAHGTAGDLAGLDLGDGATASDVAERLPGAVELLRA